MKLLHASKYLLGATTIFVVGASVALAQDSSRANPRSQQRIPISKDVTRTSGGAIRVDTITVYKTDTLRMTEQLPGRVDTLRVTRTVTQHDTVQLQPPPRVIRLPAGYYLGIAGGVSSPNGALYNPNASGPSVQAQFGWQVPKLLLGARFDVNWTQPGEDALYSGFQSNPNVWNFNLNAKLALPWGRHLFGMTPLFTVYGIGGPSWVTYRNLPMRLDPGVPGGVPPINVRVGDTDWQSNWGWNAGGGLSIGWGHSEVFAETRVIGFSADNAPMSRQMPYMLGFNWYGLTWF